MKKGQVTIFIVIGLVVLISAGLIFYLVSFQRSQIVSEKELVFKAPYQVRPVQKFVQECLDNSASRSVFVAGARGGRIYQLIDYLDVGYSNVSYYYNLGEDTSPSLDELEAHLELFVEDNLDNCTANFSLFRAQGFNITKKNISVNASVEWNSVFFRLYYDMDIRKDGADYALRDFAARVDVPLGMAYNISQEILKMELDDPDYVDLTLLSEFDANVSVVPFDRENVLYSVGFNGSDFVYLIANRFKYNNPPVLSLPDTLVMTDEEPFSYQVLASDADNDLLTFYDDTPMFDISESGLINFTPYVVGSFNVTITVSDPKGKYDKKTVEVVVDEN